MCKQNPPKEEIDQLKIILINRQFLLAAEKAEALIGKYPNAFIVWNILGVTAYETGKNEDAIKFYKKAISINSNYAYAYNNLGLVLKNQGKHTEVIKLFKRAILIQPDFINAYNNLGAVLLEKGKINEAIEACEKAISLQPDYAEAYNNLSAALLEKGKINEAIEACEKAISLQPDYAKAYNNLSAILLEKGKVNKAIEASKKALSLQPDDAEVYFNLGAVLLEKGKVNEAIEACNKALSLQPDYAEAYNKLGVVLTDLGKLEEAVEIYKKALLLKPDYPEAHYNLSLCYNLKGDLQKSFKLYEWRQRKKKPLTVAPRDHLIWDGIEPISGKKVFVYEEQGLGDTIQFVRYLLLLKQKGAEVIFKVKPEMYTLLKTLDNDIIFVDRDPKNNGIDFETPLMSLPYLFNTTLKSIPSMTSYLSADHNRIISWKKRLAKDSFKVGICWQGSKAKIDFGRSFQLNLFEGISKLPSVELISLHKGEGEKQIEDINFDLTILGDDFDNGEDAFVDTAAVIANCDLIITSDTAIAHLAGALGHPTWVLLKQIPDWRWMLGRKDSPWYPSMELYRQTKRDNWEEVFKIIKKDLKSLIKLKEN